MKNSPAGPADTLFAVSLELPAGLDEDQAGCFLACADDEAIALSLVRDMRAGGLWRLHWLSPAPAPAAEMALRGEVAAAAAKAAGIALDWRVEPVDPATNWLELSYSALPPFAVGDFYIYGSHHDGAVPAGKTGLLIDAATAFGSGEHGTTAGCLEALLALRDAAFTPRRILDVGTGSGILAIAARKLWDGAVTATDNDAEAVRVAAAHAAANGLPPGSIAFLCAEGFDDPAVAAGGPYDLVIANILAAPLKDMAVPLAAAAAPGGRIVLSGILAHKQADEVQSVYEKQGVAATARLVRGEWATIVLEKAA